MKEFAPGLAKANLAVSPAGAGNGTTASAHDAKHPRTDMQHSNVADMASLSNPNRGDRLQDTRVWVARLTDSDVPEPPAASSGSASGPGSGHYHSGALVMSSRGSLTGDVATTAAAATVSVAGPAAGSVASRRFGPRRSDDSSTLRRGGATPISTGAKGPAAGGRGEVVAVVATAGGCSKNRSSVTHAAAATATAAAAVAAVGGASLRPAAAVAATGRGHSSAASGGGSSGGIAPAVPFGSLRLQAPAAHARSSSTASSVVTVNSTHSSLLELLDAAAGMPYSDFSTTNGAVPPPSSPLGSPTASVTVTVNTSTAAAAAGLLAAACGSPVVRKQSYTSYNRDKSLRLSYQGESPPAGTGAPPADGDGPSSYGPSSYGESPLLSAYVAAMPIVGSAPLNETVRIASKRHRSASDGLWPCPSHLQQQHHHGGLLDPNSPTHLPSAIPQRLQYQLQHKQTLQNQQQHQQQHLQGRQSSEKQRLPLVWGHGAIAVLDQIASPAAAAGGVKYGTALGPQRDSHRGCTDTGAHADADVIINSNNSGDSHSDVGSHCSTDSDGLRLPPLLVAQRSLRASVDGEPPTASSAAAAAAAACRPRPAGHSLFTDSLDEFDGWQQPQSPQLQSPPPGGCGGGGGGGCSVRGPGRLAGAAASRSGIGYGTGYGSGCPWDDGGGALSVLQVRSSSCSSTSTDRIPGPAASRSPAATASGAAAATDAAAGAAVSASTAALMVGVRAFHRESAEMCAKAVSVAAMAAAEVQRRVYGCAGGGAGCTTASPPIGCRLRPPAGAPCAAAAPLPPPPPLGAHEPGVAPLPRPGGGLRLRVATGGGVGDGDGDGSPSPAGAAATASARDSRVGAACPPADVWYPRAPVGTAPSPTGLAGVVGTAVTAAKPRPQASSLAGLQPCVPAPASPPAAAAACCAVARPQPAAATAAARPAAAVATPAGAPAPLWTSSFSSSSSGTTPPSPLSPWPPLAAATPQPPPGAPNGTVRLHVPRPPAATAPSDHPPLHPLLHHVPASAAAANSLVPDTSSPTAIAVVAEPRRRQPAPPPAPAPLPACRSHRASQLSAVSEEEPALPAS